MLCLNKDVLFLIFEELKNDEKSLYSCLLVNRTWCITAVPILWRDPDQSYFLSDNSMNILFNVILLHLSEESRDILKNQGINNIITETYKRPLFNYINFWKYLDLSLIENIISSKMIKKSKRSIIRNETLKLFINRNTKFNHIHIPEYFDHQLHQIPGVEHCFSELESFHGHDDINQDILEGLARICKSIKQLRFIIKKSHINFGIIEFIKIQKNLNDVYFIDGLFMRKDESFKSLEESLIKHADTIKHLEMRWKPITRILSYLVNLLSLEINMTNWNEFNNLENLSLPILKILKAQEVPFRILTNLIENTKGHLSEISVHRHHLILRNSGDNSVSN